MAHFEARTSAASGHVLVTLTGECDLDGRDELTVVLLSAVENGNVAVVDLAGVSYLDSSGVHCLVTAYHAAKKTGVRLYVINARDAVANLLDITGVGELLRPDTEATRLSSTEDADHG